LLNVFKPSSFQPQAVLIAVLSPFLAFSIMIALRLNGADISLTRAFIPLWVFEGIVLVGILVVLCLELRRQCDIGTFYIGLFAFCVVAMLPLFQIFLAAVDAGTLAMSMRTMCIPLFIFLGLACIGLTFVAMFIGGNSFGGDD
jgi:hypothetical protein